MDAHEAVIIKRRSDPEFKRRSDRIRKPLTLMEKLYRVEELERLADDEMIGKNERHELMRLKKQLDGFKYIPATIPRKQLDSLSEEERRRVLENTPQHFLTAREGGYPDARKFLFGVRPGRLLPKEEKVVKTFRIMQKIRKTIEQFKPKEKANG
jgi:hypothetical protein